MRRPGPFILAFVNNLVFFYVTLVLLSGVFSELSRYNPILFILMFLTGIVDFFTEQEIIAYRVNFQHGLRKIILGSAAFLAICRILAGAFNLLFIYFLLCGVLFYTAFNYDRQGLGKMLWLEGILKSGKGKSLKEEVRNHSVYAGEVVDRIYKLQGLVITRFLLLFLLVSIRELRNYSLSGIEILIFALFVMINLYYLFFLQNLIEKEKLMASGHFPGKSVFFKKRIYASLITVLVLAGAMVVARNWSLFSYTVFEKLFNHLSLNFQADYFFPGIDMATPENSFDYSQLDSSVSKTPDWIISLVQLIFVLFKSLMYLLIAALIIYLIYPFFSKAFFQYIKDKFSGKNRKRFKFAVILDFFKTIREFFYYLFKTSSMRKKEKKQTSGSYETEQSGFLKQRQTNRFRAAFIQLTEAAEKAGNPYRPGSAPFNFFIQLTDQFPEMEDRIYLCQNLYNEALFSRYLLKRGQSEIFFKNIRIMEQIVKNYMAEKNGEKS